MRQGFMRFLGVSNILLACGLVAGAMWLYGREHDTRQVEREIRKLERATRLEEENIRRLEIEWQRLRNPMRLQELAALKLNLVTPDPLAVLDEQQALAMLPLRPAREEGISSEAADALSSLTEQAARSAQDASTPVENAPARAEDGLGNLIRGILQNGGLGQ